MKDAPKDNPLLVQQVIDEITTKWNQNNRQAEMDMLMQRAAAAGKRVAARSREYFAQGNSLRIPTKDEFFAIVSQLFLDEFVHFSRDELLVLCALIHTSTAYESLTWA